MKTGSFSNIICTTVVLSMLMLGSCSDRVVNVDSGTTIGPEGGMIAMANVSLSAPPGSLSEEIQFTHHITADAPLLAGLVGDPIELGPAGKVFDYPIFLTIYYDDTNLTTTQEANLVIATFEGNSWNALIGSVVDTTANSITVPIDNFSVFGVSPITDPGLNVSPRITENVLEASQSIVVKGMDTEITWNWNYLTPPRPEPTCAISHGVGEVSNGGTSNVNLTENATFTMTCSNKAGSSFARKEMLIAVAPEIENFQASPNVVSTGRDFDIMWNWTYLAADPLPEPTCSIDNGVGEILNGAISRVNLATDTIFTLTCSNMAGSDTAEVKVEARFFTTFPGSNAMDIGAQGGSLRVGEATLKVPEGAYQQTTKVTIDPTDDYPPEAGLVGTPYRFGPDGKLFSQPATITMNYNPNSLPANVQQSDLLTAAVQDGLWVDLDSVVDQENHNASAKVSHLSTYALRVRPKDPNSLFPAMWQC